MTDHIEPAPKTSTEGTCAAASSCSLIEVMMTDEQHFERNKRLSEQRQNLLTSSDANNPARESDSDHKLNLPHIEIDPDDGDVNIGRQGDKEVIEMLNRAADAASTIIPRIYRAISSSYLPSFQLNSETSSDSNTKVDRIKSSSHEDAPYRLLQAVIATRHSESNLPKWEMLPPAFKLLSDEKRTHDQASQGSDQKPHSDQEEQGTGEDHKQQKPPVDWCGTNSNHSNIDLDDPSGPISGEPLKKPENNGNKLQKFGK